MRRDPLRWRTRFGSFVSSHTVVALRRDLCAAGHATQPQTIYSWVRGLSLPEPARLVALLKISRGRLRPEDVVTHREEVRSGRRSTRAVLGVPAQGNRRD
jgi:hypothetical protein